jgi:KDO2-lipid IV(A) lauroyltransferase
LLWLTLRFLGVFPPTLLRLAGRGLGGLVFRLHYRYRKIARKNLRFAYGDELTEARVQALARDCFKHWGQVVLEIAWLMRLTPARVRRQVVLHGLANVPPYETRQGGLVLAFHFGHPVMNALMGTVVGRATMIVIRRFDWRPIDLLLKRIIRQWGHVVEPNRAILADIISTIDDRGTVSLMPDQDVDSDRGCFIRFFGRRTCSHTGPARIRLATGKPVVPVYNYYERGRYHFVVGPHFDICPEPDQRKAVDRITQQWNTFVEAVIRRRPDQWWWLHNRWRTRPYHLWPRAKMEKDGPRIAPS